MYVHTKKCPKCGGKMRRGIAIQNTYVGDVLDFPGDKTPITVHAGGTGKVITVLKCKSCGHSEGV